MKPFKHNLYAEIGREHSFTLTFPYDITGYTFASVVKDSAGTTAATYAVVTNTVTKTAVFTLVYTITAALTAGSYDFDVKQTPASGGPTTVMAGKFNLATPVTP
jgi:hypothetical protein